VETIAPTVGTCAVCGQPLPPDDAYLGVNVHRAVPGHTEPWRTIHGGCFDAEGMHYGPSLAELDDRGQAWWLRHIGGKAWAEFTDLYAALPDALDAYRHATHPPT
jgi:hypothetical protein